jgi:hypothetical protein
MYSKMNAWVLGILTPAAWKEPKETAVLIDPLEA